MSVARVVSAPDGHAWTVRRRLNWRSPAADELDRFDYDVHSGPLPAILLSVLIFTCGVVFVINTPDGTIAPKVELAVFALILFFPARWLLRRPWTVVAETGDEKPERWVGTVRGSRAARREFNRAAASIEREAQPELDGALQVIN
jgi:hypothetical protein